MAFLMDIAIADGEHRKRLTDQLVKTLIATGVPVDLDSKSIQEAAHVTHPDLPEDAIDPDPTRTYQGKVCLNQATIDMDSLDDCINSLNGQVAKHVANLMGLQNRA